MLGFNGAFRLSLVISMTLASVCCQPASAQLLRRGALRDRVGGQGPQLQAEAYFGKPFGVGRVQVEMPGATVDTFTISNVAGRVLYPSYESRPMRGLLREIVGAPDRLTAYFLFVGDEPLDLALHATNTSALRVQPQRDEQSRLALLNEWWGEFGREGGLVRRNESRLPANVQNYLNVMLSSRLGLKSAQNVATQPPRADIDKALGLLLGTESIRLAMQKDAFLRNSEPPEPANLPLPDGLKLPPPVLPELAAAPAIEAIAMRVPVECFYLRSGSFTNFQWLRHRLDEWGGDLRNIVSTSSIRYGLNERMERRLGLKETALAQLLGETVVADVALIGTDTFLKEGAAMGVLFQARNNLVLSNDLVTQRKAAMGREPGSVEEKVLVAGQEVSLMHHAGGALRSFYVADGDFHLVTTSRFLVERFLQTAGGKSSVGASAQFRNVRANLPIAQNYTAFVYLSDAFLSNLVGPRYRVEMTRRLRSVAEMELYDLAVLAANCEGKPTDQVAELVAGGYLPANFGQRGDGSQMIVGPDGVLSDSLRGARGYFTPIPDVTIEGVTPTEAQSYSQFAESYRDQWQQMDPIVVAISRKPAPTKGLERVTLEVKASPFSAGHYKMASRWLGPVSDQRLVPIAEDLVTVQAALAGGNFLSPVNHFLFGGLRDADPRIATSGALMSALMGPQSVRGYVGAWPAPGVLSFLGANSDLPPDVNGFTQLRTSLWRLQSGQFTLLSFQPDLLAEVGPRIQFEKASRPAQVWVHSDDLVNTRLAGVINAFGYQQTSKEAASNARLLNSLSEQFHVPQAECLAVAERLMDATLVCPLGGEYTLGEANGRKSWTSTLMAAPTRGNGGLLLSGPAPPADFVFPALKWFRGLNAELRLDETQLAVHAEIDMPEQTHSFAKPQGETAGVNGPPAPAAPLLPGLRLPLTLPTAKLPTAKLPNPKLPPVQLAPPKVGPAEELPQPKGVGEPEPPNPEPE